MNKLLIAGLLLSLTISSGAFELRCQEDIMVDAEETLDEDLIAIAEKIEIKGNINGDFIGAGREIHCEGIIEDDIIAVGQRINIKGKVGDNLRAAGEEIITDAHIEGDIIVFARTVRLCRDSSVAGDVVVCAEKIEIDGKILKSLKAYGKRIKIKGEISEGAQLRADKIVIFPGAKIGGDLKYTSPNKIEIRDNVLIAGETIWKKPVIKAKKFLPAPKNYKSRIAIRSLLMLPVLFIGFLLVGISPRQVYLTMDSMHKSPGLSLLTGFVFLVCLPAATAILFATIVGIPIALIGLLFYFSALYISKLFAGMAIAMKIFRLKGKSGRGTLMLAILLGAVIVTLLSIIPVAGGFIRLLLIIFGLGGLVMSRWKTFTLAREKKLI